MYFSQVQAVVLRIILYYSSSKALFTPNVCFIISVNVNFNIVLTVTQTQTEIQRIDLNQFSASSLTLCRTWRKLDTNVDFDAMCEQSLTDDVI